MKKAKLPTVVIIIWIVTASLSAGYFAGKHVGERIGAKYCNILGED